MVIVSNQLFTEITEYLTLYKDDLKALKKPSDWGTNLYQSVNSLLEDLETHENDIQILK